MQNEKIRLSPEFDFFFTFPFNLGFSVEYFPLPYILLNLDRIAISLNSHFSNYSWRVDQFNENLPLSLRYKGGFVVGKPENGTDIERRFEEIFVREQIGARFAGLIEESVVYFDHGIGSINITIRGILESKEAIPRLQQLAMAIIGEIRKTEGYLYVFDNWESFRSAMRKSFEKAQVLYDMWGILASGGAGREPTRYVGENAILRSQDTGGFEISFKEIPTLFAPFTGMKPKENANLLPFVDGITYLAQGWDGQIAIVRDSVREKWLKDLWQFATDYGTVLHDLDRYLHMKTTSLRKESKFRTLRQSKREMDSIHRIELSIDVITHETIPYNFGGIDEEIQVYRGIYDSWEMKTIAESLRRKFTFLNAIYSNLNAEISNSISVRMNVTMLVFTVLTLAGVLASVISTADFEGVFLRPHFRLFIIVFGTISAGLLAVISFIIYRNKSHSRK